MASTDILPASYAQEWYLDAASDGAAHHVVPWAIRFEGRLDRNALSRAVHRLAERHEALRTRLARRNGQVVQQVSSVVDLPLMPVDARGKSADEIRRMAWAIGGAPFGVNGGPLARAALLAVDDEEHVLVLSLHHSVSDGWSAQVLHRELLALYVAEVTGDVADVPEVTLQAADVAGQEREFANAAAHDRWARRLGSTGGRSGLPLAAGDGYGYRICPAAAAPVGAAALDGLSALAGELGTTLARVLGGVATAVIAASGDGADEVTLGVVVARREEPEVRGVVGCLTDRVPVVVDVSGDPTLRELADRFDDALWEAEDDPVPLGWIADLLRERAGERLLEVAFNVTPPRTHAPVETVSAGGVELRVSELPDSDAWWEIEGDRAWPLLPVVDVSLILTADGGVLSRLVLDEVALGPEVGARLERSVPLALALCAEGGHVRLSELRRAVRAEEREESR